MYKKLPTNSKPFPPEVCTADFEKEWLACIGENTSNLTKLLKIMEPTFEHWENLLLGKCDRHDIGFITLCQLLDKEPSESLAKINCWTSWIKNNSDIKSELRYIFVERVRKFKYKPSLAAPIMVEYIAARDFKLGIYHQIRATHRLSKREAIFYIDDYEFDIISELELPDYLLLKNIGAELNNWQSYLFFLIQQGYTSTKRSELTRTDRRNLYKEERKIWQSIKQML